MNSSRPRLNLNDAVDDLAPPPPPCFLNRVSWREYLKSAAAVQNHKGEQKVIMMSTGEPTLNMGLNYCEDCTEATAQAMTAKNRCDPQHLQKIEAEAKAKSTTTA